MFNNYFVELFSIYKTSFTCRKKLRYSKIAGEWPYSMIKSIIQHNNKNTGPVIHGQIARTNRGFGNRSK